MGFGSRRKQSSRCSETAGDNRGQMTPADELPTNGVTGPLPNGDRLSLLAKPTRPLIHEVLKVL